MTGHLHADASHARLAARAELLPRGVLLGVAAAAFGLFVAACAGSSGGAAEEQARVASDGDAVLVHYHGTLDSGEVFDSSRGREPLGFVLGSGQVIPGFDDAVRGLAPGENVTVRIPAPEAYGERRDDLVLEVPREGAPAGLGAGAQVRLGNGAVGTVVSIGEETVVVDANHPLAGQALTFELELVSIE